MGRGTAITRRSVGAAAGRVTRSDAQLRGPVPVFAALGHGGRGGCGAARGRASAVDVRATGGRTRRGFGSVGARSARTGTALVGRAVVAAAERRACGLRTARAPRCAHGGVTRWGSGFPGARRNARRPSGRLLGGGRARPGRRQGERRAPGTGRRGAAFGGRLRVSRAAAGLGRPWRPAGRSGRCAPLNRRGALSAGHRLRCRRIAARRPPGLTAPGRHVEVRGRPVLRCPTERDGGGRLGRGL